MNTIVQWVSDWMVVIERIFSAIIAIILGLLRSWSDGRSWPDMYLIPGSLGLEELALLSMMWATMLGRQAASGPIRMYA